MVSVRAGSACLMALFLIACGGSGGELPLLPPDASLTYNSPPPFTVTMPISPIVPSHNVYLTNFSIVPELPAGLTLDSATGVISGTPTQASQTTRYTVSAPDGNVALTATLVITVNPLPAGVRLLSLDTGTVIAPPDQTCRATGPCTVDGALAGPTVVIRHQTGWNTYSSVDGALIAHLEVAPGFATAWTLATDGSYLLFAGAEGVQAITPQGMTLFTLAGDYLTPAQGSPDFGNTLFDTSTGDAVRIRREPAELSRSGAVTGDYVWFVPGSTLQGNRRSETAY